MYIKQLHIKDLRIIEESAIVPIRGINLITGDNGAGKTSILEAIYLLGRGKSFRHRDAGPFIRAGKKYSLVLADLIKDDGSPSRLGVERAKSAIRVKQDGKELLKRSNLLKALPLQIIAPNSHELIEKGPDSRRNFVDYGMFHVEHGYLGMLTEYGRALKQRNAALRRAELDVARSYNALLSSLAEKIQASRVAYVYTLNEAFQAVLAQLEVIFPVELTLHAGMELSEPLENQLVKKETLDSRRGYTSTGIHRADLVVQSENVLAARRLSRGQQKVLVYALKIAQSTVFKNSTNITPILMVDDLSAELDSKHFKKILNLFVELEMQIFFTLLSSNQVGRHIPLEMFHVEHGVIMHST